MSEWNARRFWKHAEPAETEGGHTVLLDGRRVKTPARAEMVLPTRALAEAMAAEWQAQGERIDPRSMPVTRAANSAIDTVAPQKPAVVDTIAAYGGTDLLCYRAETPDELVRRQAEAWDPLLDWAEADLAAPLNVGQGVMHIPQPEASTRRLHDHVAALDPFRLAALYDLVALSGSLLIGLAAAQDRQPPEMLWEVSRLDETWQQEQWGEDAEAAAQAALRRQAFLEAKRFHDLSVNDAATAARS